MDRLDFSDVRGNDAAITLLADAAGAGHGVLLLGPPGIGKTMIARRAPALLGPMSDLDRAWLTAEYLSIFSEYQAPGTPGKNGIAERPFRAPHHTVSAAGLRGADQRKHQIACPLVRSVRAGVPIKCSCEREGGMERIFRPGEVHLARFGVLYLDDLPEFARTAVEACAGARREMSPRTRPWVIASATLCPCGWLGQTVRTCTCPPEAITRWRARVDGYAKILGLGVAIEVAPMFLETLRAAPPGPSTFDLAARAALHRAARAEVA